MISLPGEPLPARAHAQLRKYQQQIDDIADYAERVAQAKEKFSQRNTGGNSTFRAVRQTLTKMCAGVRRCAYCEDSLADEVEHIKPKDLYPEFVFVWDNYLYACGPCNVRKVNHYAVFPNDTAILTDVTRKRGQPIVPPPHGEPALIDPRSENPMHYLMLDLKDTFLFLPRPGLKARDKEKAHYTIDTLGLNDRDYLPAARAEAYGNYRARLTEYRDWQASGRSATELARMVAAIQKMQHRTVWLEMKRQNNQIPDLAPLFAAVPEALTW
jgi:uncharacterized protein (TIGR02646 family)